MIDLHLHSTASDGTLTPRELVEAARAAGLAAIALTDHDTLAGIPAFLAAAGGAAPEAIPGVELSTRFEDREIHIAGLFLDPASPELATFLEDQRRERRERGELMRQKLTRLGYPISQAELDDCCRGAMPGRPHFARILVARYGFADNVEVFDKLLRHGAPGFVPRRLPDPATAIAAIHAAGGVAVWAHPVYRQRRETAWLRRVLNRLVPEPVGLDAIEGYYSLFGPEETKLVTGLAATYGLALSGGSDFHGANTPKLHIGTGGGKMAVPDELLPELKRKRDLRRAESGRS